MRRTFGRSGRSEAVLFLWPERFLFKSLAKDKMRRGRNVSLETHMLEFGGRQGQTGVGERQGRIQTNTFGNLHYTYVRDTYTSLDL
jgi:hypothetical protein